MAVNINRLASSPSPDCPKIFRKLTKIGSGVAGIARNVFVCSILGGIKSNSGPC